MHILHASDTINLCLALKITTLLVVETPIYENKCTHFDDLGTYIKYLPAYEYSSIYTNRYINFVLNIDI